MYAIESPLALYTDTRTGLPLDGGYLYFGTASLNPETNPIPVYWDAAGTQPAAQPIRTVAGVPARAGCPATVYVAGDYSLTIRDTNGRLVNTVQNSSAWTIISKVVAYFTALASTAGAAMIGVISNLVGAVATNQQEINRRTVHLFDFLTDAQRADFSAGLASIDITAGAQAFLDACSADDSKSAPEGLIPYGYGLITAPLVFKRKVIRLRGQGMFTSGFKYTGTGDAFTTSAVAYLQPTLSDFCVLGTSVGGYGFNFSNITTQVFAGAMERLYIDAGKAAIYAPVCFSFKFDTVYANSATDHVFRVRCGPAVTWVNCYAANVPTGKAGYRLVGTINMVGCNGVNSGSYWGIFGQNSVATDGFQADFSIITNDFPDITLTSCNIEAFAQCGIKIHNSYRNFVVNGGKIDRNALTTDYESMVTVCQGATVGNNPVRLGFGNVIPGTGLPKGSLASGALAALTGAYLFNFAGAGTVFIDTTGQFAANSITQFYRSTGALATMATQQGFVDGNLESATTFNSASIQRQRLGFTIYIPKSVAPVGAAQNIDVTGSSRIYVTPAAAASITTASFTATPGTGGDSGRNGDLYIEALNGNLTINHSGAGLNTFKLKSGANATLAAGEIRHFMMSNFGGNWWEV